MNLLSIKFGFYLKGLLAGGEKEEHESESESPMPPRSNLRLTGVRELGRKGMGERERRLRNVFLVGEGDRGRSAGAAPARSQLGRGGVARETGLLRMGVGRDEGVPRRARSSQLWDIFIISLSCSSSRPVSSRSSRRSCSTLSPLGRLPSPSAAPQAAAPPPLQLAEKRRVRDAGSQLKLEIKMMADKY